MLKGFPDRLKQLRQKNKLSQADLGAKVNVHYTHIGKYERGESSPSLETTVMLARVLSVSLDHLVLGDDDPDNPLDEKKLLRQFQNAEKLPPDDIETIKKLLDAFLMKQKLKEYLEA